MSLPVLKGGVRSRFEQPLQNYRDLRFFNFGKESVEKISLDYLKSQKHSFTIISNGSSYTLQSGLGQIGQENDINSKKIDNYLQGFIAKGIEHYLDSNEVNKVLLDRLPYCVFRTKLHQQSENTYLFYSYDDLFENLGNPRTPEDGKNINRFLVKLPSQEYVTIQNRNYKHLLVGYEDFLKH